MSITSTLERDLISQTHLWQLVMLLTERRLQLALIPPVESETMIYRSFLIDPEAQSTAKGIEDIVYANPLLLSDFRSVTCLVDTPQSMAVPSSLTDEECEMVLSRAFALESFDAVMSPIGDDGDAEASLLAIIDKDVQGFLSRTFYNIKFHHALAPLCRFLARADMPSGCIYAVCRQDAVDVVALDGGNLLLANTFNTDAATDAAYYLLASRQLLGLAEPHHAPVVGGLPEIADALSAQLTAAGVEPQHLEMPMTKCRPAPEAAEIPLQLIIA